MTAPTGPALVTLTNTGTIDVLANASAVGEPGAKLLQTRSRSTRMRPALQPSPSFLNYRHDLRPCHGIRFGSERRFGDRYTRPAFTRPANAAATNFHTSYYGTATLHRTSHATEGLAGFAYGTTTVLSLRRQPPASSTNAPAGPALATLTNSGMINVGATQRP